MEEAGVGAGGITTPAGAEGAGLGVVGRGGARAGARALALEIPSAGEGTES